MEHNDAMKADRREREPVHPGEILALDVLNEMQLSTHDLAHAIGVPQSQISEVITGRRAITADMAIRLSRWLGTSPEVWLNLQQQYDLEMARRLLADDGMGVNEDELVRRVSKEMNDPLATIIRLHGEEGRQLSGAEWQLRSQEAHEALARAAIHAVRTIGQGSA